MAAAKRVEIKSQQRLRSLEPLLRKCAEEYAAAAKWHGGQDARGAFVARMQQVGRRMMDALEQNVTVNGEPWDPTLLDDDVEPRDRELLEKLHKVQTATFLLLEQVATLRKSRPSEIARTVREQQQKIDAELVAEAAAQAEQQASSAAETTAPQGEALPADLQTPLTSALAEISALTERMPDVLRSMQELRRTMQVEIGRSSSGEAAAAAK